MEQQMEKAASNGEVMERATVTNLATRTQQVNNQHGLQLQTMQDMIDFCKIVSESGLAPRGMETPQKLFIAVAMGAEVGLSPMQSVQNIAPINGRPSLYGPIALGLVQASGLLASMEEYFENGAGVHVETVTKDSSDDVKAVCVTRRKGGNEVKSTFSVAEAKAAGLWIKAGPWSQYKGRMLQYRARGFNLADNFSDVLKGLKTVEEQIGDEPIIDDTAKAAKSLNDTVQEKLNAAKAANAAPTQTPLSAAVHKKAEAAKHSNDPEGEQDFEQSEPLITSDQEKQIKSLAKTVYGADVKKKLAELLGQTNFDGYTETDAAQIIDRLQSEAFEIEAQSAASLPGGEDDPFANEDEDAALPLETTAAGTNTAHA